PRAVAHRRAGDLPADRPLRLPRRPARPDCSDVGERQVASPHHPARRLARVQRTHVWKARVKRLNKLAEAAISGAGIWEKNMNQVSAIAIGLLVAAAAIAAAHRADAADAPGW